MPTDPGSFMLCQIRYRLHGQRCINNLWYRTQDGSTDDPQLQAGKFFAQFENSYAANLAGVLSQEVTEIKFRCQVLTPFPGPLPTRYMFYEALSSSPSGLVSGQSLPSTVTAVVRKRTALAGRKYRGRIYVPGIPSSFESDSVLTPAGQNSLLGTFQNIFETDIDTGSGLWRPVVTNPPQLSRYNIINQTDVDQVLRVQRRREVGVGE